MKFQPCIANVTNEIVEKLEKLDLAEFTRKEIVKLILYLKLFDNTHIFTTDWHDLVNEILNNKFKDITVEDLNKTMIRIFKKPKLHIDETSLVEKKNVSNRIELLRRIFRLLVSRLEYDSKLRNIRLEHFKKTMCTSIRNLNSLIRSLDEPQLLQALTYNDNNIEQITGVFGAGNHQSRTIIVSSREDRQEVSDLISEKANSGHILGHLITYLEKFCPYSLVPVYEGKCKEKEKHFENQMCLLEIDVNYIDHDNIVVVKRSLRASFDLKLSLRIT